MGRLFSGRVHSNPRRSLFGTTTSARCWMERPLILASQSPRRKQLLAEAGYEFQVIAPHESAECGLCSQETPPEFVARLAYQKAGDVALRIDRGLVIGCDTVAEC